VHDGKAVKKGQVLFTLAPVQARAQYASIHRRGRYVPSVPISNIAILVWNEGGRRVAPQLRLATAHSAPSCVRGAANKTASRLRPVVAASTLAGIKKISHLRCPSAPEPSAKKMGSRRRDIPSPRNKVYYSLGAKTHRDATGTTPCDLLRY
jgi:hypothetical protein